ncbi:MAG: YeiH family protein [Vulcanimicrobiaceae bacterium]
MKILPGLVACVAIALVATVLGSRLPIIGGPVFAILIGVAIAAVRSPAVQLVPGIVFSSKKLLQWSIVLLGAHLSLAQIMRGGAASLPVMLGTLVVTLTLAYLFGRMLGLDRDVRRLLGVGTAICGGSAIAAMASVIEVDQSDVAYALGTVFFFNVVAVLTFPALGHLMHLSQSAFGLWAGTAINDTSSVVAAAFSYGHAAGNTSVIVKLTRTLLIVPIVAFYGWKRITNARSGDAPVQWHAIFPWFVVWFIVAAALNSFGVIPASFGTPIQQLALFTIVAALAGVGLSSDIEKMRAAGLRPLALGALLWIAIATSSLLIARFGHIS